MKFGLVPNAIASVTIPCRIRMIFWLSIFMALTSAVGFILAGRGMWQGWAINLASQPAWIAFGIVTKGYGLLISSCLFVYVFAKNTVVTRRLNGTSAN